MQSVLGLNHLLATRQVHDNYDKHLLANEDAATSPWIRHCVQRMQIWITGGKKMTTERRGRSSPASCVVYTWHVLISPFFHLLHLMNFEFFINKLNYVWLTRGVHPPEEMEQTSLGKNVTKFVSPCLCSALLFPPSRSLLPSYRPSPPCFPVPSIPPLPFLMEDRCNRNFIDSLTPSRQRTFTKLCLLEIWDS